MLAYRIKPVKSKISIVIRGARKNPLSTRNCKEIPLIKNMLYAHSSNSWYAMLILQKCTHSAYMRQPSKLVTHYFVRKDRRRDERGSLKRLSGRKTVDTRTETLNIGNVLIHILSPLLATAISADATAARRRTSLDSVGIIFIPSIPLFFECSPQVCIFFHFLL
jgi:hypothetical protein